MKRKWPEDEFETIRTSLMQQWGLFRLLKEQGKISVRDYALMLAYMKPIDKIVNPKKEVTKDENKT